MRACSRISIKTYTFSRNIDWAGFSYFSVSTLDSYCVSLLVETVLQSKPAQAVTGTVATNRQ